MKKKILIASYDLEIGGVERSLISMLNNFDYERYDVELLLYNHSGEFMPLILKDVKLLPENTKYKSIRLGIGTLIKAGEYNLAFQRLRAKYGYEYRKDKSLDDTYQMQLMWKYCNPYFPKVEEEYDVAISYLWPHNFVAEKVRAKKKIAWIHTDYSNISPDRNIDLEVWDKFDSIVGVSEKCVATFLKLYPSLKEKCVVVENIASPEFIRKMSEEQVSEEFEKDKFNLLTVARFSHAKGIDQGVEAIKLLRDRGIDNIKWYIVGYGGDENKIRELITRYSLEDMIEILGKKDNPYPYMKMCDLYMQPSRYEGKAVTVVEAQILAKPVLITNYPTAHSQVVDRVDGEICELSIEGIANGVEKFYRDRDFLERYRFNCESRNYENKEELKKLYELF
ncbi:glycosyltransferase [Fusobacterium mortiferum]|uniref:Glycosyltransferase n=1 Tax=Fusobacterium mortiferum TaxID=850 RepID=A0ABS2G5W2_FUSMR|nr:glycosyltransferase [Fusobacterium mortiferum]MBM6876115.1 glycosyltransferase [Fusobacterium mortiferum]